MVSFLDLMRVCVDSAGRCALHGLCDRDKGDQHRIIDGMTLFQHFEFVQRATWETGLNCSEIIKK